MSTNTQNPANLDGAATTAYLLRRLADMMTAPLQRAWPEDEFGRTTFLKIPRIVDLKKQHTQKDRHGGKLSITNLPTELQCLILSYLPAIDRVCLALTCKALVASAIASPHLRVPPWTPWLYFSQDVLPSRNSLILRLAHGWVDKSKHRYCNKCTRIFPRDPEFFRERLRKRKRLPYNVKVRMGEDEWKKLSNKKKYEHIINVWSTAPQEDASFFACDGCRTRELDLNNRFTRDVEKGFASQSNIGDSPVECPCCVIKSITETYKEPYKPKIRPKLWKWTKKTFGFLGNAVLVFIYLIYLFFKLPVDVGIWLWKKYKRSQFRVRRTLWCWS